MKRLTTDEFIKRARIKHPNLNYNYSNVKYLTQRDKVNVICPEHGEFYISPTNHLNGSICPECAMESRKTSKLLNTKTFIDRCQKIHKDKYDYSKTKYINSSEAVKIICPIHGEFEQKASSHMNKGHGCQKCARKQVGLTNQYNTSKFIKLSKIIHGDIYDYSKINYTSCYNKVNIFCKKHGIFSTQPYHHLQGGGCPSCSNSVSQYERNFEEFLKTHNINYRKRDRKLISPLELDFYLPDHKIAIEINGLYWHSELAGKDKNYHLNKTKQCHDKGIKLMHYTDHQLVNIPNKVYNQISSILNINKRKLHGRKCEVKEIDSKLKSKFLNKYHLQGNDKASVKLGLFYNNRLVSVMTFCKRRVALGKKTSKEGEYELSRFCGNFNFYVIGGASKLLKYFERNYEPSKIVTYADKTRSEGDLYYKLGFKHTHDSQPNYWYFENDYLSDKLYHRFSFRKTELKNKLKKFDPNKTEWENMRENGWNRYWDCGNMVFEKDYFL